MGSRTTVRVVGAVAAAVLGAGGALAASAPEPAAAAGVVVPARPASAEDVAGARLGLRLDGGAVRRASDGQHVSLPSAVALTGQRSARYRVDLPQGYRMTASQDASSVFIANADGQLVGVLDGAVAAAALDGGTVPAEISVSGRTLTFRFRTAVTGPARLTYLDAMGDDAGTRSPSFASGLVTVPAGYIYDPSRGSLHDYCTSSPDAFPNPFGPDADFRGPCARHDMCYERKGCASRTCDSGLKADLETNCRVTYSGAATRSACLATANIYYGAVTAVHVFNSCA